MSDNPYHPPRSSHEPEGTLGRIIAKRRFQVSMAMLSFSAAFNISIYLNFLKAEDTNFRFILFALLFIGLFFAILSSLILIYGFRFIERVSLFLRAIFAPQVTKPKWLEVLYQNIGRLPVLCFAGFLLWNTWVVLFYLLKYNFMATSIPAALIANLLGATFYLPLLIQWYKLGKSSS